MKSTEYCEALDKWHDSFVCNECGTDQYEFFNYVATYANGEEWRCSHCQNDILVDHEPSEDEKH